MASRSTPNSPNGEKHVSVAYIPPPPPAPNNNVQETFIFSSESENKNRVCTSASTVQIKPCKSPFGSSGGCKKPCGGNCTTGFCGSNLVSTCPPPFGHEQICVPPFQVVQCPPIQVPNFVCRPSTHGNIDYCTEDLLCSGSYEFCNSVDKECNTISYTDSKGKTVIICSEGVEKQGKVIVQKDARGLAHTYSKDSVVNSNLVRCGKEKKHCRNKVLCGSSTGGKQRGEHGKIYTTHKSEADEIKTKEG